jgi:membrane protein DedA with SNARE-associated domain
MDENHLKKSEEWFAKKGDITILLGRFIPGIRHVISIPAGVARMNVLEFSIFTVIGAGIWNVLLLWAGYLLEKNWQIVYHYTEYVDMAIILILFIALIYYISKIIESRKNRF